MNILYGILVSIVASALTGAIYSIVNITGTGIEMTNNYNNSGTGSRAVARSEIFGGLVVLGGDNVSPLVEIGLADLPNIGGLKPPQPPPCDGPVKYEHCSLNRFF